jgi:hypothetical protein
VIPGTDERFVQLGSLLLIRCTILKTVRAGQSPPPIKWFRNGTEVREGGDGGGDGGSSIDISPVKYKKVR